MSVLNKLANLKSITEVEAKVKMTDEQAQSVRDRLKDQNRGYNVTANTFDSAVPFRVSFKNMRETTEDGKRGKYYNYGNFTDVDVAAAIGSIVSLFWFGDDAVMGVYDADKAEAHPEFQAWLKDARNEPILKKVGMA